MWHTLGRRYQFPDTVGPPAANFYRPYRPVGSYKRGVGRPPTGRCGRWVGHRRVQWRGALTIARRTFRTLGTPPVAHFAGRMIEGDIPTLIGAVVPRR